MQGLRDYMAGRLEGGTAPFETVPPCFISWYQKVRFDSRVSWEVWFLMVFYVDCLTSVALLL